MRLLLTALLLTGSALAAPLSVTPPTQEVQPGALVILTASEAVNWTASAGSLGSTQGTRIVLEAPRTPGTITVTVTDPKDATRRAFAVVTVTSPPTGMLRLPTFVAGEEFSAAIAQDGSVWVWGSNDSNVIPTLRQKSTAVPVRLDGLPTMASISTQDRDLFGVDAKQNAWFWGRRSAGPEVVKSNVVGINPNGCGLSVRGGDLFISDRPQPDVKGVIDYEAHISEYTSDVITVAASADGRVFVDTRGSCPTLKPLDMPEPIVKVAQSDYRDVIAISRDGNGFISMDGNPAKPLAGFTNVLDVVTAGNQGVLLKSDGKVYLFSIVQRVPTIPVALPGLNDIVAVSMSDTHLLALRKDGTLFAAGGNQYGQLGNGTMAESDTVVEVVGLKVKLP